MKINLVLPVPTSIIPQKLCDAIASLTEAKKLHYVWVLEMVKRGLDNSNEFGAVVYPCRRDSKNNEPVLDKNRRIVLNPLPQKEKIKTRYVEIGFGKGIVASPLSCTEDHPNGSIFSRDRKYAHDFSLIVQALGELLKVATNTSVFPEQEKQNVANVA